MKRLSGYEFLRQRFGNLSLRSHLFALVIVSVLPFLIFAFLVLNLFANHEKASLVNGLRETTRALSSALDREFESTKTALEATATLEELDGGDLGEVYRKLRRVLQSRPNWRTIVLHDPSGKQILNLLNPFGEPLPESDIEQESFRATLTTKQPMPINFHRDPAAGPTVGYRVPVLRAGELRYVLSAEITPAVYGEMLGRQKLSAGAIATVVDGRNIVVATSARQELVGQSAGPLVRRAALGQLDGWFRGDDRDGVPSYAAYSRSPANRWAVAMIIPAAQLEGALTRSLWALGGAGVIFLIVGIMLAVIVEARITEPLDELTRQAGALGRGETVAMSGHSRVTEVENLRRDIGRTARLLEERGQERDRAEAALRELNDRLELRILERTEELEDANSKLRKEIGERRQGDEALRLSEERFRTAFDEGPIGIGMVDLEMRYLRVNQALCEMLDCRGDELLGQNFFASVHPQDRSDSQHHAERLLRGETPSYRHETRLIGSKGDVLSCCITGTLIAARNATGNYVLLLIENITESKRLEERLRETERLAAVGATSAMFAHEVGNPLNGISTTVQMIERDLMRSQNSIKPSVFSALSDIKNEITRLGALLHEFRYLARPQRLELRPARLDSLIGAVLAPDAYRARGVELQIDIPADLPAISVDEEKIKQIVLNLAGNAADAMPEGGTLKVRAYRERDALCLEFADTGTGIAPGVNIFELFTTTKANGTGLGLAVVRQVVSSHGGRIDYRSVPGVGSIFTVTLPLAEEITN